MSGIGGCRGSGGIVADTQIVVGSGKLISIHGLSTGTATGHVYIYDVASSGDIAAGNLIGFLYVGLVSTGSNYQEADMHGVYFRHGLYADVTHVSGTSTAFTVEYN